MSGDHLRRAGRQLTTLFVCGFLPLLALFYAIGPSPSATCRLRTSTSRSIRRRRTCLPGALRPRGRIRDPRRGRAGHRLRLSAAGRAPHDPLDGGASRARGSALPAGARRRSRRHADRSRRPRLALLRGRFPLAAGHRRGDDRQREHLARPVRSARLAVPSRAAISGAALGVSIAAKIFLWPLTIWLAAGRRYAAALWSVALAVIALVGSSAVVGFHGVAEYPEIARRLGEKLSERGYTAYALGLDLGLPASLAWALWASLAAGCSSRARYWRVEGRSSRVHPHARRRDRLFADRLAALFRPAARGRRGSRPRLAPIWFVGLPLQLFVTTGVYNGSTLQTASVLLAAGVTIALALAPPGERAGAQLFGRARMVSSSPR